MQLKRQTVRAGIEREKSSWSAGKMWADARGYLEPIKVRRLAAQDGLILLRIDESTVRFVEPAMLNDGITG
jgi:hypothetical protein